MTTALIFMPPFLAFSVAYGMTRWMLASGVARVALDNPSHRSLHEVPVPRTGGLAILAGVIGGWFLLPFANFLPFLVPAVFLLIISFIDDLLGLPVTWRLAAHFIAAAGFFWIALFPLESYWEAGLVIICTVWLINLYNFMDGADGLAAGMTLFGFGAYGLAAWLAGDQNFALLNFSLAFAAVAFLRFNFFPAKVFMGDAGAIPLGFFAAAIGLTGWQRDYWPLWFPFLIFSPFIVDATATLIRRAGRRERVWQAHREHYYQRLVQMGYGHRNTALLEYGLMAAINASALWGVAQADTEQWLLLALWAGIYSIVMRIVDVKWKHYSQQRANSEN